MTAQIADIIVPEQFTNYTQILTQEKSRLVQSGALVNSDLLNNFLAGGGMTVNLPSFGDLANDPANISTDDIADIIKLSASGGTPAFPGAFTDAIPNGIDTLQQIAIRLNRNQVWSGMDLAANLAGADPVEAIANRVAAYWARQLQFLFVATWTGVILDNVASNGSDYQNDVSGASFIDGVTNFTAEALINTALTAGDSMDMFSMIMVHSVVYARMQKLNLIDYIPDARGEVDIATYQGKEIIVDDGMPATGDVYDTWLFGPGATQLGSGSPKVPTYTDREERAGNGGGQEILGNRVLWTMHPVGHAWAAATPNGGGPDDATIALAASWQRVFPERKQVAFARLVTREA